VVLRNGLTLPAPSATRDALRRSLGLPQDAFCALVVGVMRPGKGHIEAISIVERSSSRPVLILAGDGPLRPDVEAQAHASDADVRVLGFRSDVRDLLEAADVLLLPSASEALPTVVIEAMAASRPVVATAVGGVPELVDDMWNGFLFRVDQPDDGATRIDELAASPELRWEMGGRGRERYEREFTARAWAERLALLYRQLHQENLVGGGGRG
jgi:glycosyltransferase involved in cell wall biosynthesis